MNVEINSLLNLFLVSETIKSISLIIAMKRILKIEMRAKF
jgi:hypothetical protein